MKGTALLRRRILSRRCKVTVVGWGTEGLSFGCAAALAGVSVVHIDVDEGRIDKLSRGELEVSGVDPEVFRSAVDSRRISFTTRTDPIADSDIVVVSTPTQAREYGADLSHMETLCKEVALHLRPGSLVLLDAILYPGTTEEIVVPILETSGFVAGRDFLLAYSPGRVNSESPEWDIRNTPRVIGALTAESAGVASVFYGQLVDQVEVVSSCRAAELVQLLESEFRHVNTGLVNEMAMICHDMGIDVWEVISAASSKPFGFMPFYPGPGLDGQVIAIDPQHATWGTSKLRKHLRILGAAQDVNRQMPDYVCSRIIDALNNVGKTVRGATVLVLGIGHGPDVEDERSSPVVEIIHLLERRRAKVSFHDPLVTTIYSGATSLERVDLTARSVAQADCVALLTPHRYYDLEWIASHASLIFDARNAFGPRRSANVVSL